MSALKAPLVRQVEVILRRFLEQNRLAATSEAELQGIGSRLWTLIVERGLPMPLTAGEVGRPGEMTAMEVAPMVDRVLGGSGSRAALADPVRQLVKACFHREFTICRDSYREVSADGVCRRQQITKALGRVSGSHCVDCPYWKELSAQAHAAKLEAEWVGDAREFAELRSVFLPEDFRALRIWLHSAARLHAIRQE